MTIENGDMPANPSNLDVTEYAGTINCSYNKRLTGLTKRETFAMAAMQGLLSNSGGVIQQNPMSGTSWCNGDASTMASLSLECADALLKELAK